MTHVHLRIIDGSQRGRVFDNLSTPVTIGREEGNTIQLNDDRVSRYHVKIQEDHDRMLLTDLTSTNGTQVNGEEVQLRILRHGDIITIGRSVILYGSRTEIAARLAILRGEEIPEEALESDNPEETLRNLVSLDFELGCSGDPDLQATLHSLEPPVLPSRLDAVQAAELSELLEYLHIRLRRLIAAASMDDSEAAIEIGQQKWQDLIDLQSKLAEYMRTIGDPDAG
jgi:pSer/pThr/pTyr-binding forkhead associated (FHA) protein